MRACRRGDFTIADTHTPAGYPGSVPPWDFSHLGDVIAAYSGGPTLAGVPAGGRAEGGEFEAAVKEAWTTFAREVHRTVGTVWVVNPQRRGQRQVLKIESRSGPWAIYWDYSSDIADFADGTVTEDVPPAWLERKFLVADLLKAQLGPGPYPFAPPTEQDSARFHATAYPELFARRTTNFDFSGALVTGGILKEKLLFEYKYAKSSNRDSIDGNAHERLAFQVLQYVEIALRYPSCSLNVIAAQAFSEYRNKYHPAFNQQAIRLTETFQQVQFRFAACRSDYIALFDCFAYFLLDGSLPPLNYRQVRDRS
jgi:hypothetical protein